MGAASSGSVQRIRRGVSLGCIALALLAACIMLGGCGCCDGDAVLQEELFRAAPRSGTAPLVVQFTARSIWDAVNWFWLFGDGGTSTEENPVHTYSAPGLYTVELTIWTAMYPGDVAPESSRLYHEVQVDYIAIYSPAPADGLVGYWPFEGTMEDATGNGRDASASIGAPGYGAGVRGLGLYMTDDRADIPWYHDDWSAFSVSAWFYLSDMTAGCGQCTDEDGCNIWMDEELNGPGTWSHVDVAIGGYDPGTNCFSHVSYNCDDGNPGTVNQATHFTQVTQCEWHHVVVTSVKGGVTCFYYDGALIGSCSQAGWGTPGSTLYLGGRDFRDNNLLTSGTIDEVRLYDRALTLAEVSAMYNARL